MVEGVSPGAGKACRGEKTSNYYIGVLRNLEQGLIPDEGWMARAREWVVRASQDWLSYSMAALVFWFCDDPGSAQKALDRALGLQEEKTSLFFLLTAAWQQRGAMEDRWMERYIRNQNQLQVTGDFRFLLELWIRKALTPGGDKKLETVLSGWEEDLSQSAETEGRQVDLWRRYFRDLRKAISLPQTDQYQYLRNLPGTTAGALLQGALLARPVGQFLDRHQSRPETWQEPRGACRMLLEDFLRSECLQLPAAIWKGTFSDFLTFSLRQTEEGQEGQPSPQAERFLLAHSARWLHQAFDDVTGETARLVPGSIRYNFNYSFHRQDHCFSCDIQDGMEEAAVVRQCQQDMDAAWAPEQQAADWRRAALKITLPWALVGLYLYGNGAKLMAQHSVLFPLGLGIFSFFMAKKSFSFFFAMMGSMVILALFHLALPHVQAPLFGLLVFLGLLAFWQYWKKRPLARLFAQDRAQLWQSLEELVRGSCAETADFRDHYRAYTQEQEGIRDRLAQLEKEAEMTQKRRIRHI